jgi:hypothetical protein
MSLDEISHLDFVPEAHSSPLCERASVAYHQRKASFEVELISLTARKVSDVLDEPTARNVKVKLRNVKDGDGEVFFKLDGLSMKVVVVWPTNRDDDSEPTQVNLMVENKTDGWVAISDLADLGRLIAEDIVARDL